MTAPGGRGPRGPVAVATAVAGATESTVAAALSGRRDLTLVRRCADVAELLAVAEAGLAVVVVVSESFPGLDADVVDRLRRSGCAVIGVVDPDRESSERLRAWAVPVVDVAAGGPPPAVGGAPPAPLAEAVLAAVRAGHGPGPVDGSVSGGYSSPDRGGGPVGARPDDRGSSPADPGHPADPAGGRRMPGGGTDGQGRLDGADAPDGADALDGVDALDGADALGGADARDPVHALERPEAVTDPDGLVADGARTGQHPADGPVAARRARLVAVWGPPGAPGRTTVAVTVASELAAAGSEVLLVDADTYAASVAQVLGLLDESPGLLAAVRAGLDGRLDPATLARISPTVSPRLRVLTGLTRAARWSEVRPAGLQAVFSTARRLVDHVVVDLASPLEEDDELSYDTAAPRRNGTTLETLRAADDVLVVGSADPVGLQRLVRGLQDLAVAVPGVSPQVVVNRVRADAVGRNPRLRVREALDRFAGVSDLRLVPDDRGATDRALLAGRTLTEAAPDSPARAVLRAVAVALVRTGSPAAVGHAGRAAAPAGVTGGGDRRRRPGRRGATGG